MEEYVRFPARDCKIYIYGKAPTHPVTRLTNKIYHEERRTLRNGWKSGLIANKTGIRAEFAMMKAFASFNSIVDMNAAWTTTNRQLKQLFATRIMHVAVRVICG